MYKISIETKFAAAHRLLGYQGNCKRIHGHNWSVRAQIVTTELDSIGIGYDFKELQRHVNDIIGKFDHQFLNEIPPFDKLNPTSENLAKYIFNSLKEKLPPKIQVLAVHIQESEKYSVIYSDEGQ